MPATKDIRTIPERINAMLDAAVDLHEQVRTLRREVETIEGIQSKSFAADVPGDLEDADRRLNAVINALTNAETDATRGNL